MKKITLLGNIANANGIVLSLIVSQGNMVISTHHYYAPFTQTFEIAAGTTCSVNLNGYTQGTFTFDVSGASRVNPQTPKSYNQNVADTFTITA